MAGANGVLYLQHGPNVCDTVLLVEDEVLIRMMAADKLRDAGYVVIEASNADEALEVLGHTNVNVRLVLNDIRMPGTIDGVALAREVRSRYPMIKVILASGDLASVDGAECDALLSKPYDPAAIISHIKRLLGPGTHIRALPFSLDGR